MFKIKGILKKINDVQVISEKFKKREFVLTDFGHYPQVLLFQLTNQNCEFLTNFSIGDEIEVLFNVRGKEWINPSGEAKYFNSIEAWKIQKIENGLIDKNEIKAELPKGLVTEDDDILPF